MTNAITIPNVSKQTTGSSLGKAFTGSSVNRLLAKLESATCELALKFNHNRLDHPRGYISELPSELLCVIFGHIDESMTTVALTSVCWRWRQISLARPELWTRVQLEIKKDGGQRAWYLLLFFLRKAENLPLSLSIFFNKSSLFDSKEVANDFLTSLRERPDLSRRVHDLILYDPPPYWIPIVQYFSNYLEVFEIRLGLIGRRLQTWSLLWNDHWSFSSIEGPHLRRLKLDTVEISDAQWVGAQLPNRLHLTHVTLNFMAIDYCIVCFSQCPNLIEFRSTKPTLPWKRIDPFIDRSSPRIAYPNLQRLQWDHPSEPDYSHHIRHFFPFARFRCIRVLELSCLHGSTDFVHGDCHHDFLQAILPNLPSTLIALRLYVVRAWSTEFITSLFLQTPNLQELAISNWDLNTGLNITTALTHSGGNQLLPLLRKLILKGVVLNPRLNFRVDEELQKIEKLVATQIVYALKQRDEGTRFSLEWTEEERNVPQEEEEEGDEDESNSGSSCLQTAYQLFKRENFWTLIQMGIDGKTVLRVNHTTRYLYL